MPKKEWMKYIIMMLKMMTMALMMVYFQSIQFLFNQKKN